MPDPREVHRTATRIMSSVMVLLGAAIIVLTVAGGGGPASLGTILGVLFAAAGVLRLRVEQRRD